MRHPGTPPFPLCSRRLLPYRKDPNSLKGSMSRRYLQDGEGGRRACFTKAFEQTHQLSILRIPWVCRVRALIMTSGTPPSEPDCSRWLRRLRMRMFLTCGSGARLAPLSVTSNASTEAPAQPSVLRATGPVPMKCKATTSPSLPANFVWSCTRLGASLGLRVAPPRVAIPKSGTCRA